MEEVVMAIKSRADMYPFSIGVNTTQITRVSRLVQNITGSIVQVNKAIVGANAFSHEAGIHQDGILKHAGTYEIMTPESVGLTRSSLVLGKHSGRHAFRERMAELGFNMGDNAFEEAFTRFKDLADKKKEIYDEDLITLLDNESRREDPIQLESLHITCGTIGPQTAMMTLRVNGDVRRTTIEGNGPIDAVFNAIIALVPHEATLKLYQVSAITQDTDAQAEVTVRLETPDGKIFNGNGSNIDTVVASALAYINALCKLQKLQARETLLPVGAKS
jgi:2-isopropylmalate synthase